MRLLLQIGFFVFYVASTYAVSQERTALIVSKVQRASNQHDTQFEAGGGHIEQGLPNYRQAKPRTTTRLPNLLVTSMFVSLPPAFEHPLRLQSHSQQSTGVAESTLSRAPPAQA